MTNYFRNSIASIVLAYTVGCMQPNLQINCPEPKKIESLMPKYNLDNVVAILNTIAVHSERIENIPVMGSTRYLVVFYDSKSKDNKVFRSKKSKEISDFVQRN